MTGWAVETIANSTTWNGGGTVTVAVDGVAIKEANAQASGDVVWNGASRFHRHHEKTECAGGFARAQWKVVLDVVPVVSMKHEKGNNKSNMEINPIYRHIYSKSSARL